MTVGLDFEQSVFYHRREQSSTLWVFVFLTPVEKTMCKCWCCTVSDFKFCFLWTISFSRSNTCFVLLVTYFTFLTGRLQFGQMSLIPPLPPILVNQSTQEMIMTHCLPNTIAPDASGVICLSVVSIYISRVNSVFVFNIGESSPKTDTFSLAGLCVV